MRGNRVLTMRWILSLAAIVLGLTATDGRAQTKKTPNTDTGTLYQDEGTKLDKSNRVWGANDKCGKESFRKFPDYTAEAALGRDAYMRDCLRKHHLPPRNDVAQPLQPRP